MLDQLEFIPAEIRRWIPVGFILLVFIVVLFMARSLAKARYEDNTYEGSAFKGAFHWAVGVLVFNAATSVEWKGSFYDSTEMLAVFFTAPLFLMGACHIVGDITNYKLSNKILRIVAGVLLFHATLSIIYVVAKS